MNVRQTYLACVAGLFAAAAGSVHALEIETRLNGLDVLVEPLGVEGTSSEEVDLRGVRAVKVTNRTNEWVLCEFTAIPEQRRTTDTAVLEPNDTGVLRVPGKYTAGGPLAVLECVLDSQNDEI
ncbi:MULTISPECIES: hypothetical protein [Pseudomonas]|uniref:hypothetical protein n=1 Tax=Pseudomonas TaxID=286 RepID=UPI0012399A9B|nr:MULTISPECIES: hypothetical protein [Pseudomonas]QIB52100.1 hypothetical protein G3M63_14180 [Pseudomonas sp. OIL-1]